MLKLFLPPALEHLILSQPSGAFFPFFRRRSNVTRLSFPCARPKSGRSALPAACCSTPLIGLRQIRRGPLSAPCSTKYTATVRSKFFPPPQRPPRSFLPLPQDLALRRDEDFSLRQSQDLPFNIVLFLTFPETFRTRCPLCHAFYSGGDMGGRFLGFRYR